MKQFLKRTNKTNLTDDELIIFDVLFDKYTSVRSLEGGNDFELFFNYPTHSYEIEELRDVLNKQIKNGIMSIEIFAYKKQNRLSAYIGLTIKGGEIWAKERKPDWDSYVIDYSTEENGISELSVYSPSLKTAENFINTSHKCKLYEMKGSQVKSKTKIDGHKVKHIPWKIFPELYEIKAILTEREYVNGDPGIDWELYKRECKWWRNVTELLELREL